MDKNPCGEINLPGANPSSPPTKPGVYITTYPSPPLGTVTHVATGLIPLQTVQVITDGNGNWYPMDVDHSEEAGRTTQALVDKLAEIEAVYNIYEAVGVCTDDKTKEYNAVEEELIHRGIDARPIT